MDPLSSIVSLRLTGLRYLDDEGLEGIAERCVHLRELAISGYCNEQLTDAGVRNVIIHRTELCAEFALSKAHYR
jgi:hypothetical protein